MLVQHALPLVSLLVGSMAEVTFPSAACNFYAYVIR